MSGRDLSRDFELATEGLRQRQELRNQISVALTKLNEIKRLYLHKQYQLSQAELTSSRLDGVNRELKVTLMNSLILKEEVSSRCQVHSNNIEIVQKQIEELERDSNGVICDDDIDQICDRFSTSNQLGLLNKIQEAKYKLVKYGLTTSQLR